MNMLANVCKRGQMFASVRKCLQILQTFTNVDKYENVRKDTHVCKRLQILANAGVCEQIFTKVYKCLQI